MPVRPMLAAAALAVFAAIATAQPGPTDQIPVTLKVGDSAPPLAVERWVKGEPAKIEAGKIHVVEFWATWCGPCRITIPHLSELAKKHPDIVFIGQDIWERGDQQSIDAKVDAFVKSMGDKMDYRVATDDYSKSPLGVMGTTWMLAAGQNGLPTAFIVGKDGKIAWIGSPLEDEFDETIEKVKAGTYDAKAAAEARGKLDTLKKQFAVASRENKIDDALKASAELIKTNPQATEQFTMGEYVLLARAGRFDDARVRANTIMSTGKKPESFNTLAWSIAVRENPTAEDLKLARAAADKANAMTENKQPDFLDSSARLYAVEKNWAKAVETQRKAIEAADGDEKEELKKALESYEKKEMPAAK